MNQYAPGRGTSIAYLNWDYNLSEMLGGSTPLAGHFLFNHKPIKDMSWTYTTILHEPRKLLRISVLEYTVLDIIYQSQVSPKYGVSGWATNGCHKLAEFIGCSPATILGVFDRMEKMGYLEFNEVDKFLKKTTEAFYSIAYEKDKDNLAERQGCSKTERVQKLNGGCSETEQSGVQKLNGGCSETEHKYKLKEKENKKEKKGAPSESVKEVIDYLNTKANTSFKATTKETIQFVTARQKVDGWELEDFKLIIDFKVYDWGKDDRMKQYICPSTLFRASNAEKYMQAAKAWKESSKVGQNGQIRYSKEEKISPMKYDRVLPTPKLNKV